MKTTFKKNNLNDILIDKAAEYLENWSQRDEKWSDLAIMLDEGDVEMASSYMLGTGAIDSSKDCLDEEQAQIEETIEKLGKAFNVLNEKQRHIRYNEVFKNTHLYDCEDCNHISFVKYGNEKLYAKELKNCWQCDSTNVIHRIWSTK